MKINYKNYMVFPYTINYLSKNFDKKIIEKYGEQLAFLFQNGYSLKSNTSASVVEQMALFNDFENYSDFEELKKINPISSKPTRRGYKITQSVIDYLINNSEFATSTKENLSSSAEVWFSKIEKNLDTINLLFNCQDLEVKKVMDFLLDDKTKNLVEKCLDLLDEEKKVLLFINYCSLYSELLKIHNVLFRMLLDNSSKGASIRVGNLNDELYGSAGGFNPNTNEIICRNGSAVYNLKTLCDKNISTESLRYKLKVLVKECIQNGEDDALFVSFNKGNEKDIETVRKALAEISFNGIMVLLELKHGLTLFENDSLNEKRAKRIMQELEQITKYANYNIGGKIA